MINKQTVKIPNKPQINFKTPPDRPENLLTDESLQDYTESKKVKVVVTQDMFNYKDIEASYEVP